MWKIKRSVIQDACEASRNYIPDEFMCFLGGDKKKQTVSEIVMLPTMNSKNSASVDMNAMPIDNTIIGSLHSHPGGPPAPSRADRSFFRRHQINVIIGGGLTEEETAVYDAAGKPLKVIVE